jgi:hypothetical protein
MFRVFTAAAALSLLSACSPSSDVPLAQAGVASFHQQLNGQRFDAIYAGSGKDFKGATTQADFVQLLAAIHRKLGNFQSGASGSWNDSALTSGHFVTLSYSAKYERGSADETFIYRIDAGRALLAGYHVNSTALIVN